MFGFDPQMLLLNDAALIVEAKHLRPVRTVRVPLAPPLQLTVKSKSIVGHQPRVAVWRKVTLSEASPDLVPQPSFFAIRHTLSQRSSLYITSGAGGSSGIQG